MPATHYIIAVQVALVAATAAYYRSDSGAGKESSRPAAAEARAARAHASDDAAALTAARGGRFSLSDQGEPLPDVGHRSMGFRTGVPLNPRNRAPQDWEERPVRALPVKPEPKTAAEPPQETAIADRAMQSRPAAPIDLPPTRVPLSGEKSEEVKFAPVPDGKGYSITADSATNFDLNTKTVVFSGHVTLHCSQFTLTADRLVVHMQHEGGAMSQMVANGDVDVKLISGAQHERFHGFGEEATYDPAGQKIVFRGWPRIIGHGREHRAASAATKMTLFTNPAKLVTEGRAQTRILPGEGGSLAGFGQQ